MRVDGNEKCLPAIANFKTAFPHDFVITSQKEMHFVPGLGKFYSVISADCARSDNRNFHNCGEL